MKPHQRKDNPPRREPGDGSPEGAENPGEFHEPAGEGAEEGYSQEVGFDPGAALVDENQNYGYGVGYQDPGSEYQEPAQPYYDPNVHGSHGEATAYDEAAHEAPDYASVYGEVPPPPPPPSRSTAKKKVPHRAAPRRPAAGRTAGTTRRTAPKPVYGGGISVMTVFLSVIALGMLAAVIMVVLPKDLSKVGGYPANPIAGQKPRNLLAEAQKVMIERNTELGFTEAEVNQYLNHRLSGEQKGAMAALVKFRGVCVDFSPGKAEVVIEREFFGMPMTMSVDLVAEEFRRQVVYKPSAWHLGKISLGARTVKPVVDLFVRLRGQLIDEYHTLQQMTGVRFEADRVVLDARI